VEGRPPGGAAEAVRPAREGAGGHGRFSTRLPANSGESNLRVGRKAARERTAPPPPPSRRRHPEGGTSISRSTRPPPATCAPWKRLSWVVYRPGWPATASVRQRGARPRRDGRRRGGGHSAPHTGGESTSGPDTAVPRRCLQRAVRPRGATYVARSVDPWQRRLELTVSCIQSAVRERQSISSINSLSHYGGGQPSLVSLTMKQGARPAPLFAHCVAPPTHWLL
jgi:hypothetical protein